tara:strand:+ start:1240 stop:1887 length:648 start_codon:yes stop_codon:yes gene_type:complete
MSEVQVPILQFRDSIRDLARPNLFQVELFFPEGGTIKSGADSGINSTVAENSSKSTVGGDTPGGGNAQMSTMLVKAANLPASTVGVVDVPYRGRVLKIAGDRTFEPWTVTVLNDEGFALRAKFEAWSSRIQDMQENLQHFDDIQDYQKDAFVRQYDRQGNITRSYKFASIWPSNISAIDLAWDSNDTPEEYTVEFQVQYWEVVSKENAGNAKPQG